MDKFISNKTIILYLFKYSERNSLSFGSVFMFFFYLSKELARRNLTDSYLFCHDISIDSIKKTLLWNNIIFDFDYYHENHMNDNKIYLKNPETLDQLISQYPLDDTIIEIISNYCMEMNVQIRALI